jgi:hypothetical protein
MSIRRVVPNIASDKLDACREFYAGLLGFQVAMDMGWILTLVSPSNPTAQLSVVREDASAPVVAQVTVEVADVDAVHAEAVRRGLELVHPLAQRLVGDGELVVDVPAKLAARVRVLSVGHGRKSDPHDAVSVARRRPQRLLTAAGRRRGPGGGVAPVDQAPRGPGRRPHSDH